MCFAFDPAVSDTWEGLRGMPTKAAKAVDEPGSVLQRLYSDMAKEENDDPIFKESRKQQEKIATYRKQQNFGATKFIKP